MTAGCARTARRRRKVVMTEGELMLVDGVLDNPESGPEAFRGLAVRLVAEVRRLNGVVESLSEELLRDATGPNEEKP